MCFPQKTVVFKEDGIRDRPEVGLLELFEATACRIHKRVSIAYGPTLRRAMGDPKCTPESSCREACKNRKSNSLNLEHHFRLFERTLAVTGSARTCFGSK